MADGAPVVEGTRMAVHTIACYYQMGLVVDEISTTLSHSTVAQVHSALAYYFDHQQESDSAVAEYSDVERRKSQAVKHQNMNGGSAPAG